MPTQFDARQSVLRSAQAMIGSAANDTLDTIFPKINNEIAKVFEDRNVVLGGGGTITVNLTGTSVTFSSALILYVNSLVSGAAPSVISLASTTRAFSTDGNMLYAVIDRVGATATVTADATSLPAVTSANQEVFLIAKRIGTTIVFRDGMAIQAGMSSTLAQPLFTQEFSQTDSATTGANTTLAAFTGGIVRLTNGSLTSISGIPAGLDGQSITLHNATGNSYVLNNEEATATAANRIITGTSASITIKSNSSILLKYDGTTSRWRMIGGSGSGSGSGVLNFILNPDGEAGTTGWATYADAAGSRPVDGTGGSPTVTWGTTTVDPLSDLNCFTFTKGASNTQGQGVAYQFTVDKARQAKVLTISMDYIVRSGIFVAGSPGVDSDLICYIYDVTNSQLIEPSSIKFLSNSATLSDKFQATFQTSATGTTYRLILHCATTSASAYTLGFDNIAVSPSNYVYGTPITDWQTYTPTGSWNVNTTYIGRWRRVGQNLEYRVRATLTGAPNNVSFGFTYPAGMVLDTTAVPANVSDTLPLGQGLVRSAGNNYDAVAYNNGGTGVFVTVKTASGSYTGFSTNVSATVPATFANTDVIEIYGSAPIAGWSSSAQTSDTTDTRVVSAKILGATPSTNNGVVLVPSTVAHDTHAALSSGRYTIPVSGYYHIHGNARQSSAANFTIYAYVNGGLSEELIGFASADTNTKGYSTTRWFNAGQIVDIRPNATVTLAQCTFAIDRLTGPSAIAASESVAAHYGGTTSTVTNAGDTTLILNTKISDTHNSYNTSTGVYTVPISGKYLVIGQYNFTATSTLSTSLALARVYKNGGIFKTFSKPAYVTSNIQHILTVITYVECIAGDTINIATNQQYAAGAQAILNDSTQTFINIARLGN